MTVRQIDVYSCDHCDKEFENGYLVIGRVKVIKNSDVIHKNILGDDLQVYNSHYCGNCMRNILLELD